MRRKFIVKLSHSMSDLRIEALKREFTIEAPLPPLITGTNCLNTNKKRRIGDFREIK